MGKRVKVGKQRKDKFYKLAKETGYRSRASFKLIQLNRKFEFLQSSRVLIDLCAAPGGWLQVAQKTMPVSSLIIGVDLVPIRPIPDVITLQEDITTDKCRQALKKQLKTWKADTILHDGAPNIGKNWVHDAFTQTQLTLSALKLATEMLAPNGWFITKVFRSKDYNSLLWVLGKLFKKIHVTKPQASRNESAEIFVVCQSYVAPDRIDPRFLDPSFVFKDVEADSVKKNVLQVSKRKPKAEGYEDGDKSVFSKLKASDFIFDDNYLEKLSSCHEIIFDNEDILNHRTTTNEVKEYCKDLKVLGKGEIRSLLSWRKNLRDALKELESKESTEQSTENTEEPLADELDVEHAVKEAQDLETSKYQQLKRKKKKMLKEKRKTQEKMNLKMIIKDDEPIIQTEQELFTISKMKSKKDLMKIENNDDNLDFVPDVDEPMIHSDDDGVTKKFRSNYVTYNKHDDREICINSDDDKDEKTKNEDFSSEDEEDDELDIASYHSDDESVKDFNHEEENAAKNPLLVDLITDSERTASAVSKWYDADEFADLSEDDELDMELLVENVTEDKSNKKVALPKHGVKPVSKKLLKKGVVNGNSNGIVSEDIDLDDEEEETPQVVPEVQQKKKKKKRVILDPEGLALGALMIRSKKTKRDILDAAYNRYSSNDENLPDWFVKDEMKHYRKQLPVTPEMVNEYKSQLKEINARPIKKVVEAKARKKKRALRRLEKARKRAEAITENLDMSEAEKASQLKSIYKKAVAQKDNKVTYVVAKKGIGKRARRPPGVKGRFKMVDRRMKKDDKMRKTAQKSKKGVKKTQKKKKNK